jgi:hypothetical protein
VQVRVLHVLQTPQWRFEVVDGREVSTPVRKPAKVTST